MVLHTITEVQSELKELYVRRDEAVSKNDWDEVEHLDRAISQLENSFGYEEYEDDNLSFIPSSNFNDF